jgi:hypothetical protein
VSHVFRWTRRSTASWCSTPMPAHVDERLVFDAIAPSKDRRWRDGLFVDGNGDGRGRFASCTPGGIPCVAGRLRGADRQRACRGGRAQRDPRHVGRADPDELIAGPPVVCVSFRSRCWPGFLSTNPLSPAAGSSRREGYRPGLPPAGRIISGGHAARDAAHCSRRSRQISAAALTKGRRATGGLRSGCHEIPSRRGGGSGRMGTTATFGSFSSTVRSGSTA